MGSSVLPIYLDLLNAYQSIPGQRTEPPPHGPGSFDERRAAAEQQLREKGITDEQRSTYLPANETLYRSISPWGYSPGGTEGSSARVADAPMIPRRGRRALAEEYPAREDAWRLYLGMPQQGDNFEISPYQPSTSQDKAAVYYRLKNFWPDRLKYLVQDDGRDDMSYIADYLTGLGHQYDDAEGVMGNYKWGRGIDENGPYLSYYDRWDLDKNAVEGGEGRFGKPFELYDRLYYDPKTNRIHWGGPPVDKTKPLRDMQRGRRP